MSSEQRRPEQKNRLLVVEDDPDAQTLLKRRLQRAGYEVVTCTNGREAIDVLGQSGADIIITDWFMPEMNGIDLCHAVHELHGTGALGAVYLIVVTAHTDKSRVLEAFEAGADDFLSKPYDLQELLARIRVGQRVLRLQAELMERQLQLTKSAAQLAVLNQELEKQANTDALTGLPNRRHVLERFRDAWALAQRGGRPLSCIMTDIDHFKQVNDTHGHNAGDDVLRNIALRIAQLMRRSDICGRFGGEEFLIICPDGPADGAATLAERIRANIAQQPIDAAGTPITVTLSSGAAAMRADHETPEALIAEADQMLYAAKDNGRNQVWLADAHGQRRKLELPATVTG